MVANTRGTWFERAHRESADGTLVTAGARTEQTVAKRAKR
jgi:hypothetical protein